MMIDAPAARIYDLAARIERWPELLPHYRWVTILRDEGEQRLVEMAASRDGVPIKWVSIQRCDPERRSIHFRHVRGVTRGMVVDWTLEPVASGTGIGGSTGGTLVRIVHDFDPPWPRFVGPLIARYVVGDLFVHNVAAKTLRRIKMLAESMNDMADAPTGAAR